MMDIDQITITLHEHLGQLIKLEKMADASCKGTKSS